MMNSESKLEEAIISTVENYIQTVVLVDDMIYERKSGVVTPQKLAAPQKTLRMKTLKSREKDENKKDAVVDRDANDDVNEVSFHDVQDYYAKKKIICSLYQPKKNAGVGVNSDVYKLCTAADVIVVDWQLHDDSGKNALELIANIVYQSKTDVPEQTRLIIIYTLEQNLGQVASDVFDKLEEKLGNGQVNPGDNELVLVTSNCRIVIFGKREHGTISKYNQYCVPEKKLAEKTIEEFSKLTSGLLQTVVLKGLASIRENNLRILTRFNESLDLPFLIDRHLLDGNEYSFSHLMELLTEEISAIFEDRVGKYPLGNKNVTVEVIKEWVEKNWNHSEKKEFKDIKKPKEGAMQMLSNGGTIKGIAADNYKRRCSFLYGDNGEKNAEYHYRIAALMNQRMMYDKSNRKMHLGTIIKEQFDNKRYLMCLQPACDSVRLNDGVITFIFCEIEKVEGENKFTHIIVDRNSELLKFKYSPSAKKSVALKFNCTGDELLAKLNINNEYQFQGIAKNETYDWVAELKNKHAQRAVEEFGRSLSRVGLTGSELLRLISKPN